MGDSLPKTPTKYRAKFNTASFILVGKIRNRTNKQKKTKKQTVNDNPHLADLHVWIAN